MQKLAKRLGHDMCPGNFTERIPHNKILQISPPGSPQTTKCETTIDRQRREDAHRGKRQSTSKPVYMQYRTVEDVQV